MTPRQKIVGGVVAVATAGLVAVLAITSPSDAQTSESIVANPSGHYRGNIGYSSGAASAEAYSVLESRQINSRNALKMWVSKAKPEEISRLSLDLALAPVVFRDRLP